MAVEDLTNGMILREDLITMDGVLLVCEGQEVTTALQNHLGNFVSAGVLNAKVLVTIPESAVHSSAA